MTDQDIREKRRSIRRNVDERYQPTQAELEADVTIEATPEELAAAVVARHPHRRCGLDD